MKILIIGGGGREHALAWRLAQSASVSQVLVSPGNPGIAQVATCLPAPSAVSDYLSLAQAKAVDLTIVGPEAPLVAGLVDHFRHSGEKIIGPTQNAARLEGSKIFAKEFFRRAGIPTARSGTRCNDFSFPLVVKADGLAAGKGVVIAYTQAQADEALGRLGKASPECAARVDGPDLLALCRALGVSAAAPAEVWGFVRHALPELRTRVLTELDAWHQG